MLLFPSTRRTPVSHRRLPARKQQMRKGVRDKTMKCCEKNHPPHAGTKRSMCFVKSDRHEKLPNSDIAGAAQAFLEVEEESGVPPLLLSKWVPPLHRTNKRKQEWNQEEETLARQNKEYGKKPVIRGSHPRSRRKLCATRAKFGGAWVAAPHQGQSAAREAPCAPRPSRVSKELATDHLDVHGSCGCGLYWLRAKDRLVFFVMHQDRRLALELARQCSSKVEVNTNPCRKHEDLGQKGGSRRLVTITSHHAAGSRQTLVITVNSATHIIATATAAQKPLAATET